MAESLEAQLQATLNSDSQIKTLKMIDKNRFKTHPGP
jgi:hypothetical protein